MKTKLLILLFTLLSGFTILGDRVIELRRINNTVECTVCHESIVGSGYENIIDEPATPENCECMLCHNPAAHYVGKCFKCHISDGSVVDNYHEVTK